MLTGICSYVGERSLWAATTFESEDQQSTESAAKWVGFATPHFELYTTNGESVAYEAIQRFEAVHDFFEQSGVQAGLLDTIPQLKVRVIAFRSAREFSRYRVSPVACAYYQRTHSGDYIMMQDLLADHYQVGVHEYTHFLFRGAGMKLPLWLNEGLADFYSSLESHDGQVLIGRPPYGRLHTLRAQSWINLKTLFAIEQTSPYYTQPAKMALFYAESWVLTHMLAMHPAYAAQFPRFVALISNGTPSLEALRSIYQKDPEQLAADLNEYVQQRQLPVRAVTLNPLVAAASNSKPQPLANPRRDVDFALADLAAANPYSASGDSPMNAAAQLDEVSKRYPESPAAEESLGYLALTQNRMDEARVHFAEAVQRHSIAPDVLYYAAHLDLGAGAPLGPVIELLQRTLALDPGHYYARFDLAFAAAKADRFELAVATLNSMTDLHPEHRYLLAYSLAYCYVHMDRVAEAQVYAEKAARLTSTQAEQQQSEHLLHYIGVAQGANRRPPAASGVAVTGVREVSSAHSAAGAVIASR